MGYKTFVEEDFTYRKSIHTYQIPMLWFVWTFSGFDYSWTWQLMWRLRLVKKDSRVSGGRHLCGVRTFEREVIIGMGRVKKTPLPVDWIVEIVVIVGSEKSRRTWEFLDIFYCRKPIEYIFLLNVNFFENFQI